MLFQNGKRNVVNTCTNSMWLLSFAERACKHLNFNWVKKLTSFDESWLLLLLKNGKRYAVNACGNPTLKREHFISSFTFVEVKEDVSSFV